MSEPDGAPGPPENDATVQQSEAQAASDALEEATQATDSWDLCKDLAHHPRILDAFERDLKRAGVVGEGRAAKLLFLVLVSRRFDRPVAAIVKGPSSAGKSWLVESVLRFFPTTAYYSLTAMSERALAYGDEPLSHRTLVIGEAAGLGGAMQLYLLRSLLSEGRIDYETVEVKPTGLKPKRIQRAGPTGLILTTTRVKIHDENETRMLSISVSDSLEQTRAVLRAIANGGPEDVDYEVWHALQAWIEAADARVEIPFATTLSDLLPTRHVRLRRDFRQLLTLVRAHALLQRARRGRSHQGHVIAQIEDYAVVRDLVEGLLAEALEVSVQPSIRETVDAVQRVAPPGSQQTTTLAQLASVLRLDKSTVSRRVRAAISSGWLVNQETKRGLPMRLVLGDPMPLDRPVLPDPEVVAEAAGCCSVAVDPGGIGTLEQSALPPLETYEV